LAGIGGKGDTDDGIGDLLAVDAHDELGVARSTDDDLHAGDARLHVA